MWLNYLATGWRSLLADRFFTFVNLLGLAVGLASVIVLSLHVAGALGADRWLPVHRNLYRIDTSETMPGRESVDIARAPGPLADTLLRRFPQIEGISRAYPAAATVLQAGRPYSQSILAADPNFLSLLGLPMVSGSAGDALRDNSSVALSARAATRYFGTADVIGRRITIAAPQARDFTVSAVFETLPAASHMDFDVVIPAQAYFPFAGEEAAAIPEAWGGAYFHTYARLRDGSDPGAIERELPALVDRSLPQWLTGALSVPAHEFYRFRFVAAADVKFDGGPMAAFKPGESRTTLIALSTVGLLILMIAAINFANLSSARSTLRAREVALRKVVGARRRQIFAQFIGEAVLLTGIAGLIGLSLVELSLPYLSHLLGLPQPLGADAGWTFWAGVALAVLATAILSGFHPALVISRIRPSAVFRRGEAVASGGRFREALVVVQFAVSIALIAATIVMLDQMQFARAADVNFERDNMLIVRLPEGEQFAPAAKSLRDAAARTEGVVSASLSSAVPSDESEDNLSIDRPGEAKPVQLGFHRVDSGFFRTYGVAPLAGRTASTREAGAEGGAAVINEAALERLGFADAAAATGAVLRSGSTALTVAGVVPNLHFRSLREPVRDEIFILDEQPGRVLSVRLATADLPRFLARIDGLWRTHFPEREIDRSFLDERINALYEAERRQVRMLGLFSALAILLSCLGLLAMAAFAVQRRRKEIAVRKVLGARTSDVARSLLWGFARPVLLANLIAWPAAWWAMRTWLNGFDARVELGIGPFAAASLLALAIALSTVAAHAVRVARTNPIHALRYE